MFNFLKKGTQILSPVDGDVITLDKVPDQVFSQKMLGDGFAVKPTGNQFKSPVDGKIVQIFPTNHAFGIETSDGLEILVHIGIDTVDLKGEGFTRIKEVGDTVKAGDVVIEINLDYINTHAKSSITPVIITSPLGNKTLQVVEGKEGYGNIK